MPKAKEPRLLLVAVADHEIDALICAIINSREPEAAATYASLLARKNRDRMKGDGEPVAKVLFSTGVRI